MQLRNSDSIAEVVRSSRLESNRSQADLAREAQVSLRWLQKVEAGEISPTLAKLLPLLEALGRELHIEFAQRDPLLDEVFEGLTK